VLDGLADLSESRECFTYHNSVTLDGFADGIGNPNAFRASSVSVIPEGQSGAGHNRFGPKVAGRNGEDA
ncbi:MAG TPA: hypothetical protein PKC28_15945, partial [Bdellovibrionales bacterium]|nr:hypothetical protein [Bdellovibrionales bacterium]